MPPFVRAPIPGAAAPGALAMTLALLACSGGGAPEPLACSDRSQCAADAFCRAGSCVRSAPPVARIASLASDAPRANRVLAFDASSSRDPDAEDRIVAFTWRAVTAGATCEPATVEASATSYRVIFPCAGEFRVEVVATDSAGVESAPAALALSVAPDDTPAPSLRAGPALAVDHRCEGAPLVCTPLTASGDTGFTLSASVSGGRAPVSLRWTASPPAGVATPYSLALSDSTAEAPSVALRTSGRIAGTWTFTVLAIDADGRASAAQQAVVVGNRPPQLVGALAAVAVHHQHDPAAGVFRAWGSVPAPAFVDPDGDAVTVRFGAESSGDGGSGFSVGQDGAFAIAVPASAPQHLIGEGVVRRVAVEGDDGNGGSGRGHYPIAVLNRPPRIALGRSTATVPHAFDATRRVYHAATDLSDYVDDDGDPIAPGDAHERIPGGCGTLTLSGATLRLGCEVPLSTVAALATLVGSHLLEVTVRDPWSHSDRAAARIDVTNRAPLVTATFAGVKTPSIRNEAFCCQFDFREDDCAVYPRRFDAGDGAFSAVADPDGDPLDVSYEGTSAALLLSRRVASGCTGQDCAVGLHLDPAGSLDQCVTIPDPGTLNVSATDGVSSAAAAVPVWRFE